MTSDLHSIDFVARMSECARSETPWLSATNCLGISSPTLVPFPAARMTRWGRMSFIMCHSQSIPRSLSAERRREVAPEVLALPSVRATLSRPDRFG